MAFGAYFIWGLMPFYMKALDDISPIEIVAHRVIWSVPIGLAILVVLGRTADLRAALRSPRSIGLGALTAALIATNWSVYIYAIVAGHAVQAALGYYINPLFNVVLGLVFLGERLTRRQALAVTLAAAGVALLAYRLGGLPWISLVLPLSFGCYGILRKTLPIGPAQGFTLEVILMTPLAIALVAWYVARGEDHFGFATGDFDGETALMLLAGPLTAAPLVLFASGAKRLRYATIGLMQYLTPTMIFLIAIFVFREPFDRIQLAAFVLIWIALAIYSSTLVRRRHR
ncbi:EamA family transporter RarD [Pararhizobium mangrovi]|uniref:EamA family transporter RarD n=2 Tax=Pararhizobium mangrovi TaxID=2590452 RepID=A0A506UEJ8_9HYPH|nr:EamA family transporter RarD [Pararhizobium mangrovi]